MFRFVRNTTLIGLLFAPVLFADVIIFVDGTQMEVRSYEIKGGLVVVTTPQGELRSLPQSYVDLEATEKANRARSTSTSTPPQPQGTPLAPVPESPPEPQPISQMPTVPPPEPEAPPSVTPPPPSPESSVPPPVWTDEELKVSLVVPSPVWQVETQAASFDVAVRLDNPQTGARATLALVRQRIRNYRDFQRVIGDIERSITSSANYQPLGSGLLPLDPYTAHEFRYTKSADGVVYFNRMVIYYSRDLVYVLSLTCPHNTLGQNETDFDALVRGLVIKKVRKDITPKGVPQS